MMEVDIEYLRESSWGPWVAFLFSALAFYALWELLIGIRRWYSRSRGPWSNTAYTKRAYSNKSHNVPSADARTQTSPSSSSDTVFGSTSPTQDIKTDVSEAVTEQPSIKPESDLIRMDASRRRKQRDHRLNIKSRRCDWMEDTTELHEGKIRWVCGTCGGYAFTFSVDEPTTCRRHEPRQGL
jgi:hypothetical protein